MPPTSSPQAENTPRLTAALEYLSGWLPVFPVCSPRADGKRCLEHANGKHDPDGIGKTALVAWKPYQTRLPSEEEVRGWWRQWPHANIAFATGSLSGFVVVDLDGADAVAEAHQLGWFDDGPWAITGRVGGQHRYCAYREDEPRNFARAHGIDYRGEGGYVILPPSRHRTGASYAWKVPLVALERPELPRWINDLKAEERRNGGAAPVVGDVIASGSRNATLASMAGTMRRRGFDESAIFVALLDTNNNRCRPPLDDDEVQQIAHSVAGYPATDFTVVPTDRRTVITGITGLISMQDVTPEAVRWIWPPRIALGKVTVLEGDPDQGKSLMTVDLAARLSRGDRMPDGATPDIDGPSCTVLLTAEDGLADTVRPRLEAAGAVLSRIHVLDSVPGDRGDQVPPELPRDIPHLRTAIESVNARLVIVDVIMAYLGEGVKALADQDIRRALRPLAKLAEELNVAIIILRHLTKGGGANPMYRGGGAVGLGAAARSVLLAGGDPKVPDRHLLARVKGNLAPPYPTLAYQILEDMHATPFIRWHGPSSTSALEILVAAADAANESLTDETPEAIFLEQFLAGGERLAAEVDAAARKQGLKYRSVWRASQRLGVKRRQEGFGSDCKWIWSLSPSDSSDHTVSGGRNHCDGDVPW